MIEQKSKNADLTESQTAAVSACISAQEKANEAIQQARQAIEQAGAEWHRQQGKLEGILTTIAEMAGFDVTKPVQLSPDYKQISQE